MLLLVLAVGVLVVPDDDSDAAADVELRGELVAEGAGVLPITASPASYHLSYRAERIDGDDVQVFTEELTVRRPFDGHIVVRAGEPPGGDVQLDATSVLGRSADTTDPNAPVVTEEVPVPAVGDIRLDASLQDLLDAGVFVPRERRRVLGRECQVYRTGSAPETQTLAAPTATEYVDVCVDAAGLVLEEVTVSGGQPLQRSTLASLELDPVLADDAFTVEGDPVPVADGGTSLTPVDPAAPVEPGQWTFARPPEGFTLEARYVATALDTTDDGGSPGAAEDGPTTTAAGDGTVQTTVEVWVAGPDALILQQGPVAGEGPVDTTHATSVPLELLGDATFAPGATGNVLVAHPDEGRFVHLTATRAQDALVELAGGLSRA
jgi:hypothetical protein